MLNIFATDAKLDLSTVSLDVEYCSHKLSFSEILLISL